MSKLKINEIKGASKEEIQGKIKDLYKELIKNNAQIATGTTPKSPGEVKNIKKNIARLKSLLHSKKEAKAEESAKKGKTEGGRKKE